MATPAPQIVVAEPHYQEDRHSHFNAALLETVRLAFPEARVVFWAEPGHTRWVRQSLRGSEAGETETSWVEAPRLPALRRAGRLRRAFREWRGYRKLIVTADRGEVRGLVLCSASKLGLVALSVLGRGGSAPILVFLHQLYYLEDERRNRWPRRLWNLERLLALPFPRRVRLLAPGTVAFETLQRRGAARTRELVPFDPPYLWARQRSSEPPPAGGPLRLGFFGVGRRGRIEPFFELAERVRSRVPETRFVLVGHLKGVAPGSAGSAVEGLDSHALERRAFSALADGVHYAVWTGGEDYELRFSASFLDALSHVKPMLCLRGAFAEHHFHRLGDIGYLCEDLEEMYERIVALAEAPPRERYRRQCERILAGRRLWSPAERAPALAAAFEPRRRSLRGVQRGGPVEAEAEDHP